MIGTLFAGALAGLAVTAWPIYLHFRQRRRRHIQIIPSLLIFAGSRKRTRQLRLRQLLLLAARVLVVAFLCGLLAQPWLRSAAMLPLPTLSARMDTRIPHLGIVLDDSLTAFHATATEDRLQMGRKWLLAQLERAPESVRVVVAPTSFTYPTPFLSKREAIDLITRMERVPEPGDADRALRNVAAALNGQRGRLLVVAARSAALWGNLRPETDFERPVDLLFFDTTACQAECIVSSVAPEDTGGATESWACAITGTPPQIKGRELTLSREQESGQPLAVSMADALRGRVSLRVDAQGREAWYTVSLKESYAHPWFSWYFRSGLEAAAPADRVILFRDVDAESLAAERVLTAALMAARPELEVEHRSPADAKELPDAGALVFVGNATPDAELSEWLRRRIESGVRILCVPTRGLDAGAASAPRGVLPAWGPAVSVTGADNAPLQLATPSALPCELESLLPLGLDRMETGVLVEPRFSGPCETVLATRGGRTVLAVARLNARSSVWALGSPTLPPGRSAASSAAYPLFPLVVASVLFPSGTGEMVRENRVPEVGQNVNLCTWFGRDAIDGTWIAPDGVESRVHGTATQPVLVHIGLPGRHVLKTAEGDSVGYANARREPATRTFSREEWAAARPRTPTQWLGPVDTVDLRDARLVAAGAPATLRRDYDLSPVAIALLVLALLVEELLLARTWRAPEAWVESDAKP